MLNSGLNSYKRIIYSQWGEDGVLEEIFRRIGTTNKFCVEFGAGNGYELSNTWNLISNHNWNALLLDSNVLFCETWKKILEKIPRVKILNRFIGISGEHSLEKVLKASNVSHNFDLLSIDIDSNDYHIFRSIKSYKPRVIIIEHNPTVPPDDSIVQDPNETIAFGSSAKANVDLAHEKGYLLVAATQTNCIFVNKDDFPKLTIEEPSLSDVFDPSAISYVISSFNGASYLKSVGQNPVYGWLYRANNVTLKKSSLRAFTFGASLNRPFSKSLSEKYQPIKILRDSIDNTGSYIYMLKSVLRLLLRKK